MDDHEYERRREAIRREIQAAVRDADWARIRLDVACDDMRELARFRAEEDD